MYDFDPRYPHAVANFKDINGRTPNPTEKAAIMQLLDDGYNSIEASQIASELESVECEYE